MGDFDVTIPPTPDQPAAITNSPQSKISAYSSILAYNAGIYNQIFLTWGNQKSLLKMNYDWNTTGKSVYLTFIGWD